jgi:hypothetical protein
LDHARAPLRLGRLRRARARRRRHPRNVSWHVTTLSGNERPLTGGCQMSGVGARRTWSALGLPNPCPLSEANGPAIPSPRERAGFKTVHQALLVDRTP